MLAYTFDGNSSLTGLNVVNPSGLTFVPNRLGVNNSAASLLLGTVLSTNQLPLLPSNAQPRTSALWIKSSHFGDVMSWGGPPGSGSSQTCCSGTVWINGHFDIHIGSPGYSAYGFTLTAVGGSYDCVSSLIVSDNSWHHLAVTYNGITITLYLDGASVTSCPRTLQTGPNSPLYFGKWLVTGGDAGANSYVGALDDAFVYKRALSGAEISMLYAVNSSNTCVCNCAAGSAGASGLAPCTPCAPGYFASGNGSLSCLICPGGAFSAAGATMCTLCAAGSYSTQIGAVSNFTCQQCPGGHYCPAGTSSLAHLNCGRGNYCPDGSGAPTPCPYQVPPTGGWGALQVQGPAFLVETARCLNHCFWNFTSGDGMLSRC